MAGVAQERRGAFEARLETAAWGMIAILVAAVLLPSGAVAELLACAAGAGLIGVNAVRRASGIAVNVVSVVLGGAFLVAGAAALAGTHVDVLATFFLALGIVMIVVAAVRVQAPSRA
jgi:hypothetical protein